LPHGFSWLSSMFCLLFRKFLLGVSRFGNESTCNPLASGLRESNANYLKTLSQLQTLLRVQSDEDNVHRTENEWVYTQEIKINLHWSDRQGTNHTVK
jgi:hypothetical protein